MKVFKRIGILLEMIKFEHTLFALPFAYLGALLAAGGLPGLGTCLWILLAMVGARTAAMGFNRIVDLPFDAKNPRTRVRALPRGEAKKGEAWAMVIIAAAAYFYAAYSLNPLAFSLSPWFLAIVLVYSYTKRFTALCHVFLGLSIGLAPIAGWVAVRGDIGIIPVLLGVGVLFWVAGFDVLYACLDEEFDRNMGLHSIPAAIGKKGAFLVSAFFHILAFTAFVMIGPLAGLNWVYYIGLAATFILLVMQRRVISPDDLSRMDMAFFTFNAAISIILFMGTAISVVWGA